MIWRHLRAVFRSVAEATAHVMFSYLIVPLPLPYKLAGLGFHCLQEANSLQGSTSSVLGTYIVILLGYRMSEWVNRLTHFLYFGGINSVGSLNFLG